VAAHVARPRVVGGQRERGVAVVPLHHLAQVLHPAEDVLTRVERILDADRLGGFRHELHQALGPGSGAGPGVEPRFNLDDRLDEIGVHTVKKRGFLDDGLEGCALVDLILDRIDDVVHELFRHAEVPGDIFHGVQRPMLLVAHAAKRESGKEPGPGDVAAVRATPLDLAGTDGGDGRMPAVRVAAILGRLPIDAFGVLSPLVHPTPFFSPSQRQLQRRPGGTNRSKGFDGGGDEALQDDDGYKCFTVKTLCTTPDGAFVLGLRLTRQSVMHDAFPDSGTREQRPNGRNL